MKCSCHIYSSSSCTQAIGTNTSCTLLYYEELPSRGRPELCFIQNLQWPTVHTDQAPTPALRVKVNYLPHYALFRWLVTLSTRHTFHLFLSSSMIPLMCCGLYWSSFPSSRMFPLGCWGHRKRLGSSPISGIDINYSGILQGIVYIGTSW